MIRTKKPKQQHNKPACIKSDQGDLGGGATNQVDTFAIADTGAH